MPEMGKPFTAVQMVEDDQGSYLHLVAEMKNGRLTNHEGFVQQTNGVIRSARSGVSALAGKVQHNVSAVGEGTREQYEARVKKNGNSSSARQVVQSAGAKRSQ